MSQDPSRRSRRVSFAGRVKLRGACGFFDAAAEDISRSGLRVALLSEVLRLDPAADLAAAAACVQTRIGSRFGIDLGLTAAGRGRVRRQVELVRLMLEGRHEGVLGLGLRFLEPLSDAEARELNVELPCEDPAAEGEIRQVDSFTEGGRAALDPRLAEEKVESLFGVPVNSRRERSEHAPSRELRALVRPEGLGGAAPLVGIAGGFTETVLRLHLSAEAVAGFGAEPGDFPGLARGIEADYGTWPGVEILDGTSRIWHGQAHPCGLEVSERGDGGVILRLTFGRRLQQAELERLCA